MGLAEACRNEFFNKKQMTAEDTFYLDFIMKNLGCMSYGSDPEKSSAKYFHQDYMFKGGEPVFKDGFIQIIDALAKGIDIELYQEVTEVIYSDNKKPVRILTKEGKCFECDHVIVTLPIGILKSGDVRFTPELPKTKQAAI